MSFSTPAARDAERFDAGLLTVDTATRRVTCAGHEVETTRLEFGLLAYMAARPGRAVRTEVLLREVWGFRSQPNTRTVDTHVYRVRRKLAGLGCQHAIETVVGHGYRLVGGEA